MADLAAYDLEPGQERWFEIEEEPGRVVQYRLAGDPEDMNSGWNFSLYRMHARPGADEP